MNFDRDVVVVGGCGHVGLPLGLAFAERGLQVVLYDINQWAVDEVASAQMPFDEAGAQEVLERVLPEPPHREHGPRRGLLGRARGGRDRHPSRRAPEPRPQLCVAGGQRTRSLSRRRTAPRC